VDVCGYVIDVFRVRTGHRERRNGWYCYLHIDLCINYINYLLFLFLLDMAARILDAIDFFFGVSL